MGDNFKTIGVFKRKKGKANTDDDSEKVQSNVRHHRLSRSRTYCVIAIGTGLLILIAIGVVNITSIVTKKTKRIEPPDVEIPLPPSLSTLKRFQKAAISSDGPFCSSIGKEILFQNGSAVDAAIAALFCNGIINSQSMGLGGGFLMTIYNKQTQRVYSLNARETAPEAATEEMFQLNPDLSKRGGLAVGIPGELAGYWAAHKRFGRLPWSTLIQPSLKLCRQGYEMSKHQYDSLNFRPENIFKDSVLREVFVNSTTGKFYTQGTKIINSRLCETLAIIADEGGDVLYNGSLADALADDIQERGGIITKKDLQNYRARWDEPILMELQNDDKVYSSPPPGSGVLLALILNIVNGYHFTKANISTISKTVLTYHRIVEAFKFAFAKRTELGDAHFVNINELVKNSTSHSYGDYLRNQINSYKTFEDPLHYGAVFYNQDDFGTSHVSVLSQDGDAVSVTSTIDLYFGAGITSKQTGIILNSAMDDFSSPYFKNYFGIQGSPANRLEPGKQPLSSMCPTIIINPKGDVRLVIGGAGGTKITTATAFVIIRHLWFGEDIKEAIDASRIHHQLYPMEISYEFGVLKDVIKGLKMLGHRASRYRECSSILYAIAKINDTILANADFRKESDAQGI